MAKLLHFETDITALTYLLERIIHFNLLLIFSSDFFTLLFAQTKFKVVIDFATFLMNSSSY